VIQNPSPIRKGRRYFGLLGLGLILIVLIFLSAWLGGRNTDRQLIWINPSQLASRPGPLTIVKYKVVNLMGPFLRGFLKRPIQMEIDSRLMTVSSGSFSGSDLGPPTATSSNGVRAWITSK